MKDKSCGTKRKNRNSEGKNKQSLSDLERAKKQFALIVERFEAGLYEDLEETYDMIEDMQNLESIIEERSYRFYKLQRAAAKWLLSFYSR